MSNPAYLSTEPSHADRVRERRWRCRHVPEAIGRHMTAPPRKPAQATAITTWGAAAQPALLGTLVGMGRRQPVRLDVARRDP